MRTREELLLAVGVRVPAWQKQANCRGMGASAMYTNGRGDNWSVRASVEVCDGCPVKAPCLSYALEHRDVNGCWGGTSQKDRKKMLRVS